MTSRISTRAVVQQDMYELFHDYWNIVTAINSYVAVLGHNPDRPEIEKEAIEEIRTLSLRLESDLDAMRSRVLANLR